MTMNSARFNPVPPQESRSPAPRLDTRTVLQGAREVILVHGSEEYRLKVTSSGKLILTK